MNLTAEQRAAMLDDYASGRLTVAQVAERHGVTTRTVHAARKAADVPSWRERGGPTSVEVVSEMAVLLPVYPVRLVSRPGEEQPERWTCRNCANFWIPDDFIHCPGCGTWRPGFEPKGGDDGRSS